MHGAIDYLEGVAQAPHKPVADRLGADRRRSLTAEDIDETMRDLDRIFPGMLDSMGGAPANDAGRLPGGPPAAAANERGPG
ncbi:MAG: hypothetical protein ACYC2H_01075 [Thermoplasmatota archaeon]